MATTPPTAVPSNEATSAPSSSSSLLPLPTHPSPVPPSSSSSTLPPPPSSLPLSATTPVSSKMMSINIVQTNTTLNSSFCSSDHCLQHHGFNFSFSVPLSSMYPKAFLTLQFLCVCSVLLVLNRVHFCWAFVFCNCFRCRKLFLFLCVCSCFASSCFKFDFVLNFLFFI